MPSPAAHAVCGGRQRRQRADLDRPDGGLVDGILTSNVDSTNAINAVSCASTELCVAGDSVGNLQSGVGRVLSVTIAGVGSGSVSSLPSGISCPTACSSTFAPGREGHAVAKAGGRGGVRRLDRWRLLGNGDVLGDDERRSERYSHVREREHTDRNGRRDRQRHGQQLPRGDLVSNSLLECLRVQRGRHADCQSGCGVGVCRLERRLHRNQQFGVVMMSSDQNVMATFNAESSLTVSVGGSGLGKVTSTPAGISCPGTCSADFATGAR